MPGLFPSCVCPPPGLPQWRKCNHYPRYRPLDGSIGDRYDWTTLCKRSPHLKSWPWNAPLCSFKTSRSVVRTYTRARKKPININIWAGQSPGQTGTVPGTNGTPPRDKTGPVPGTNRPFSLEFHSKIAILSRLSLGQVGVRPWKRLSHKGRQKNVYVFSVYWFFAPNTQAQIVRGSLSLCAGIDLACLPLTYCLAL